MKIGFTTTVPVEIILAAGGIPVDLNNRFITSDDPDGMVRRAERAGFPRNCCSWIKGIYAAMLESGDLDGVVMVTQGDCSNTHALSSVLKCHLPGLRQFIFSYPYPLDRERLGHELHNLAENLGTTLEKAEAVRSSLASLRARLSELDRRTWQDGTIRGQDNFLALLSSSDFKSDLPAFGDWIDSLLSSSGGPGNSPAEENSFFAGPSGRGLPRLGLLGVPPIFTGFVDTVEQTGGRVVYNEIPRQFAMLGENADLVAQYAAYTYPYGFFGRLEDIVTEIARRKIDGVINYVQSFCFRQIEEIILRERISIPVLTIEGSEPGPVDARTRFRIEAFTDMLGA